MVLKFLGSNRLSFLLGTMPWKKGRRKTDSKGNRIHDPLTKSLNGHLVHKLSVQAQVLVV